MASAHGFGSAGFAAAFTGKHADYEPATIRAQATEKVKLLEESINQVEGGPALWNADPVITNVDGLDLPSDAPGTATVRTVDAFFRPNGRAVNCSPAQMDALIARFSAINADGIFGSESSDNDFRSPIRDIEQELVSSYAGDLIANQAIDFQKQDGVTEIEESVEANPVDHKLNDQLLADEAKGLVSIRRVPAFIGCVSNFSNFLDLFRKTLRLLEVGVPCIILSRSNTTQHHFRWFRILNELLAKRGVDKRMLSYVTADIEQQRRLMQALSKESAMYFTGSRAVAAKIKEVLPRLVASTGGPNTMVAVGGLTPSVKQSVRWSVGIENSGQCTAMRHLVAPNVDKDVVHDVFEGPGLEEFATPSEALGKGAFSGNFKDWGTSFQQELLKAQQEQSVEYSQLASGQPIAFKVQDGSKFPYGIQENWRRMFLDVTSPSSSEELKQPKYLDELAKWLTVEQPIVLAINGDSEAEGYPVTRHLFEKTSQVVYSVGQTSEDAASKTGEACLTCQARPQDGEIFGEFPPRKELTKFTMFPVTVPSSTAGYNSQYTETYLESQAARAVETGANTAPLANLASSAKSRGYIRVLADYLAEATAENPRRSPACPKGPHRTALWGLQRPPLNGEANIIRAGPTTSMDQVAVYLAPFWLTNARGQVEISVDHANQSVTGHALNAASIDLRIVVESDDELAARSGSAWNIVDLPKEVLHFGTEEFPLAGPFVSLVLPLGHIKSSKSDDTAFIGAITASPKWLKMFA